MPAGDADNKSDVSSRGRKRQLHAGLKLASYFELSGTLIMDDRHVFSPRRVRQPLSILVLLIALQALLCMFTGSILQAQEASWIWSPTMEFQANERTQGEVWFRKKFTLIKPEVAQLNVAAGDEYELYINDKLAARGESYGTKIELDVRDYVMPGVNLVAARVRHISGQTPGLAVRLRIREQGETRFRSLVSDDSWKTHNQEITDWEKTRFEDRSWLTALPSASADAVNPQSAQKKIVATIESTDASESSNASESTDASESKNASESTKPMASTPVVDTMFKAASTNAKGTARQFFRDVQS